VCVCVCILQDNNAGAHTYIHAQTYIHAYIRTYTYTYTHIIHTCILIHTYIRAQTHRQTHTQTHTHRWVAPECIEFWRYTHKSDVYAFGTLLWELWSNCRVPFAVVTDNSEVARRVMAGARPGSPEGCPDAVYRLMQVCWRAKPGERPEFTEVKLQIHDIRAARKGEAPARGGSGRLARFKSGWALVKSKIWSLFARLRTQG